LAQTVSLLEVMLVVLRMICLIGCKNLP